MEMILKIEINSANQECVDAPKSVAVRAMHNVQREISDGNNSGKIRDINGNSIGKWLYVESHTIRKMK